MKPVEIEFLLKDNTESGLDNMSGNLSGVQSKVNATRSAIETLTRQMTELTNRKATPDMDQSANVAKIEALRKKIAELRQEVEFLEKEYPELEKAASAVNMVPPDADRVKSTYNGLHNSIQQIAREMPTLAMGPQMFFMAISNNLPVFTDELARARKEYAALQAEGKKGVPVWKQVTKSLFSWQTAMTTSIMLLVMHGDKIVEWAGKVLKGKSSADSMAGSLDDMREALDTGDLSGKIADFEKLSRAYRQLGDDADAKKKFIEDYRDEIDKTGISVDNIHDADNLFINNSDAFVESLKKRAMAMAGMKLASEQYEKALQRDDKDRQDVLTHEARLATLRNKPSDYKESFTVQNGMGGFVTTVQTRDELIADEEKIIAAIKGRAQAYRDAGNAYIDAANRMDASADKTLENAGLMEKDDADATKKAAEQAQKEAEERKRQAEQSAKRTALLSGKLAEMEAKARAEVSEMAVDTMREGYDKERNEADNKFEQEKERIRKEMEERLSLYAELRKAGADVPKGAEERTKAIAAAQTVQLALIHDKKLAEINARENKDTEENLSRLLDKYGDFESRRVELRKQGDKDIAELEKLRTKENSEAIDKAIENVKKKIQDGLEEINSEESDASASDNGFLKNLFGDKASLPFKELQELISQARQMKAYLSGNGEADGITFITKEQLDNIIKSPDALEKLKKSIDVFLGMVQGGSSNRMSSAFKTFEKGLTQLSDAKSIKEIGLSLVTISEGASEASGELSKMFDKMGETEMAEIVKGLEQVFGAVSNIGKGFAKGGIVGGLGAFIGESMNFIASAAAAENIHFAAMKEIQNAQLSFQREYNLLLMEQNLLMKEASTIFGDRQIMKAADALEVYRQAQEKLDSMLKSGHSNSGGGRRPGNIGIGNSSNISREESKGYRTARKEYENYLSGLSGASIVTGHEKTGIFGWGKGRDVYSGILSIYPELIDANGKLDTAILQTILDTRQMSDETRAYLENLMSLTDVMEEAEQALKDYLGATFGSLGDGLVESVAAALDGSQDALESFAGNVGDVFADLGEQLAYSLFFADEFKKLEDDLFDIFGSGKSEKEIVNDAMSLIDGFYDGIGDNADAALEWMKAWQEKAAEKGFDVWKDDNSVSQSGKQGAFAPSMTYDQGTKLEGLFTAGQIHWSNIDDNTENISAGLGDALSHLRKIEENTGTSSDHLAVIKGLVMQVIRDGLKVK